MVGGSVDRSCSSAYRRVAGKGGPKKGGSIKGTTKKRRRRRDEEEHEEEEPAQDVDYTSEAEKASGGARGGGRH
jgi:hypothetical protein